ncbi:MAG: hypothetical protein HYW48_12340 [Deltaproteobacteria bacterium]|nr:hypothetical protein [Deltaproteobacteria bacterium]
MHKKYALILAMIVSQFPIGLYGTATIKWCNTIQGEIREGGAFGDATGLLVLTSGNLKGLACWLERFPDGATIGTDIFLRDSAGVKYELSGHGSDIATGWYLKSLVELPGLAGRQVNFCTENTAPEKRYLITRLFIGGKTVAHVKPGAIVINYEYPQGKKHKFNFSVQDGENILITPTNLSGGIAVYLTKTSLKKASCFDKDLLKDAKIRFVNYITVKNQTHQNLTIKFAPSGVTKELKIDPAPHDGLTTNKEIELSKPPTSISWASDDEKIQGTSSIDDRFYEKSKGIVTIAGKGMTIGEEPSKTELVTISNATFEPLNIVLTTDSIIRPFQLKPLDTTTVKYIGVPQLIAWATPSGKTKGERQWEHEEDVTIGFGNLITYDKPLKLTSQLIFNSNNQGIVVTLKTQLGQEYESAIPAQKTIMIKASTTDQITSFEWRADDNSFTGKLNEEQLQKPKIDIRDSTVTTPLITQLTADEIMALAPAGRSCSARLSGTLLWGYCDKRMPDNIFYSLYTSIDIAQCPEPAAIENRNGTLTCLK